MPTRKKLTTNFYEDEFACKCGCGEARIAPSFVERLQAARTIAGISFNLRSGVRCVEHNDAVGGVEDSEHVPEFNSTGLGHAADIETPHSSQRYLIVYALLRAGFTRIGVLGDAIHVGDSPDKPRELLWHYF